MNNLPSIKLMIGLVLFAVPVIAQDSTSPGNSEVLAAESLEQAAVEARLAMVNNCVTCHGDTELWEGDRLRFFVNETHLANDIHVSKGIMCHDCHGGDPKSMEFREAHSAEAGYRVIESPRDVPAFCGHCHSNTEYMSRFNPSPKTNQEVDYWTSGHGKSILQSAESKAANCTSCHSYHDIQSISDSTSPTYPTNVAKMCATCHSDAEKMEGIEYHGRPIGTNQYDQWMTSVHANMMFEKGDLSAPTCNDCHGNHGSVAPDKSSVASACATCHGKIGDLFAKTSMKHRFDEANMPGCASCHGKHAILLPTEQHPDMDALGIGNEQNCSTCHFGGEHGAAATGAFEVTRVREAINRLKDAIGQAEEKVEHAEQLGMLIHQAKFRLIDAQTALKNARVDVHAFSMEPLQKTIDEGISITEEVKAQAEAALAEYTFRRIWVALSLLPLGFAVLALILFIRAMPDPVEVVDLEH